MIGRRGSCAIIICYLLCVQAYQTDRQWLWLKVKLPKIASDYTLYVVGWPNCWGQSIQRWFSVDMLNTMRSGPVQVGYVIRCYGPLR